MRTLIFSLLLLSFVSCDRGAAKQADANSGNSPSPSDYTGMAPATMDSSKFTRIEWIDQDRDYGKVEEGQKVEVSFRFRNVGEHPLIIYTVSPGCGCTAAEPPKEPILPGKEGAITGSFDSKGRAGTNNKSIYVKANTLDGTDHNLRFKVEVTASKQ